MNAGLVCRDELLSDLNESVHHVSNFLGEVDEDLFDGYQSAREVLSHLVFWHREYHAIACALLLDEEPELRSGCLADLNRQATAEFQEETMEFLAEELLTAQRELHSVLTQLEDWDVNFPFKKGCRRIDVAGRIDFIINHLKHHLGRQQRAFERGEAWIKAYYPESA